MREKKLGRNNKLMFRIDNLETNDIDSLEMFKPRDSRNCSPLKLYEDHAEGSVEKRNANINVGAIIGNVLLIVGIVVLIAIGLLIYKEFR